MSGRPAAITHAQMVRDVVGILRRNPGEPISLARLAEETGYEQRLLTKVMNNAYSKGAYQLHRCEPQTWHADQSLRFFVSDGQHILARENPALYKIVRAMTRRDAPCLPSEIAEETGLVGSDVAEQLDRLCAVGSAVRCELLMRGGIDRFEYRLSATGALSYGGRRKMPRLLSPREAF